jgi:hypothetical protein
MPALDHGHERAPQAHVHRTGAVDQQHPHIEIATLAAGWQVLLSAAGVLPWDEAELCSELPSVAKVLGITNRCHERASHSTNGRCSHRWTSRVHTFGQWFSVGLASRLDCDYHQGSESGYA